MKISLTSKGKYLFDVFDDDYKIATVELFVDDKYWLNQITLEGDCLDKKYGPAIIKHLTMKYKPFKISLSSKTAHSHTVKDSNDTRCLTFEGFNLAKKCFQNGILSRQNFGFPYPDELIQYKTDRFLDNKVPNLLNFIYTMINLATDK